MLREPAVTLDWGETRRMETFRPLSFVQCRPHWAGEDSGTSGRFVVIRLCVWGGDARRQDEDVLEALHPRCTSNHQGGAGHPGRADGGLTLASHMGRLDPGFISVLLFGSSWMFCINFNF